MNDSNNSTEQNVQTLNYNTAYNANVQKKSIGLGLSSMLIGILGMFLCCCLLCFNNIWIMCGVLGVFVAGLMMGIVAVSKDKRIGSTNGMGIAGIILCSIQIFFTILIIFSILYMDISALWF